MNPSEFSYLAEEMWAAVREYLPAPERHRVAKMIYDKFKALGGEDWSSDPDDVWAIAYPDQVTAYNELQKEFLMRFYE